MSLSYLTDSSGNNTAVVIPISEWDLLAKKHGDLHDLEAKIEVKTKLRISQFKGTRSKKTGEMFNKHVGQNPGEWNRNA